MLKKTCLITLVFLVACTVGPDYEKPNTYEDSQVAAALNLHGQGQKIARNWYAEFGDERLNRLVDISLQNSPSIKSGLSKLKQARQTVKINRATYLPDFSATATYDFSRPSENIGLTADTNYLQIGFDASWELDIWGAGRRLNEQSWAQYQESAYNLRQLQVVLAAEVANNYFLLKTTQEKLKIAQNNLKLQRDIFDTVKQKFDAGLTSSADYNQARYVVETTKAAIPALEYQMKAYQNALAVLAGVLPNEIPADVIETKRNPVSKAYRFDTKKLKNLPADIIRSRPDVQAAERALAAQNAAIGQAVAALYPNVSISALFGWQSSAGSRLFNHSSEAYSYAPSFNLPIFNWGKLRNNVELQKEIKEDVFENYRQTVLEAIEELSNAMVSVEKEFETNHAQRRAVQSMEQVIESLKIQYENGLIEFSNLLQTEQDLLEAQTNLAESNGKIYQDIIAYYKATGGGYNN